MVDGVVGNSHVNKTAPVTFPVSRPSSMCRVLFRTWPLQDLPGLQLAWSGDIAELWCDGFLEHYLQGEDESNCSGEHHKR